MASCAQNKPVSPSDDVRATQDEAEFSVEKEKQSQATTLLPKAKVSASDKEQYQQGVQALNDNNLARAQALFSQFIRNNPRKSEGYASFALIYFKKKDYENALKHINTAIELNPELSQALNLRAQLYIKSGKIHKAKTDYLLAIKFKPDYINAHYNLALLYDIYFQEIELAIKHYSYYLSQLTTPDKVTKDWVMHLKGTLKNG